MLNNYFIIRETASFLNKSLPGYNVEETYSQYKDKFVIHFCNNTGSLFLEFSAENRFEYVLTKDDSPRALRNTTDVLEGIKNKTVISVNIKGDERCIDIELSDGIHLYLVLIPGKGNAYIIQNNIIMNYFKRHKGKENTDPDAIFSRRTPITSGTENLWEYLKSNYGYFGQHYLNDVLHISGLAKNTAMDENVTMAVKPVLKKIEHAILNKPVYLIYKTPVLIPSLMQLEKYSGTESVEFSDINKLTAFYVSRVYYSREYESLKEKLITDYQKSINIIEKKIKSLEEKINSVSASDKYKKFGDIILSYISAIEKGSDRYIFEDIETGRDEIIKLEPSLSPSANAQKYFDKYKKERGSIEILNKKLESLKQKKTELKNKHAGIQSSASLKELRKMNKAEKADSESSNLPFRKFTFDQFEVWVGKDSYSNDLLTTKYASPNDLWFHVRGASGSHTILKISGKNDIPGKEIIQAAASIAAYYSKARKAGNVPVAYCQKKYVKKKKGFKQGSVVMEREKVIFVKPGLPAEG